MIINQMTHWLRITFYFLLLLFIILLDIVAQCSNSDKRSHLTTKGINLSFVSFVSEFIASSMWRSRHLVRFQGTYDASSLKLRLGLLQRLSLLLLINLRRCGRSLSPEVINRQLFWLDNVRSDYIRLTTRHGQRRDQQGLLVNANSSDGPIGRISMHSLYSDWLQAADAHAYKNRVATLFLLLEPRVLVFLGYSDKVLNIASSMAAVSFVA